MENRYPFFGSTDDYGNEITQIKSLAEILIKRNKAEELEKLLPLLTKQHEKRENDFYESLGNNALTYYSDNVLLANPTIKTDDLLPYSIAKLVEKRNRIVYEALIANNDLSFFGLGDKDDNTKFHNKFVDNEGLPMLMFHGVRKYNPAVQNSAMGTGVKIPFGTFDPQGFPATYFSPNLDYAKFYAGVSENQPMPDDDYYGFIYPVILKAFNPIDLRILGFKNTFKNYKDYIYLASGVKIKNPNPKAIDENKEHPVWGFTRILNEGIKQLKAAGVDGLIQIGDVPIFDSDGKVIEDRDKWFQEEEYLTFYPDQVISVIERLQITDVSISKSSGTGDIRIYKKGGYVSIKWFTK